MEILSVCLMYDVCDNFEPCDWSMRFSGVIFHGLSLVRIYLGQASGLVLQYKCTLSVYFTITVEVMYKSVYMSTVSIHV